MSDLFFTLAVISGGYYIWLRGGGIFRQGIPGVISFLFETLIILSTSYYLYVYLQRDRKKSTISDIRSVAGSIDIFVIIENKNIEAVKATLESIGKLDTNMQVYKFLICDECTDEIEIFTQEYKCRVLHDDPKNPFNEEGINLAFLKSEAKYLIFVKSGSKLAPNFIGKTLPHFIDENVCLVQGARKISFEREVELKSVFGFAANILSVVGVKSIKLDMLSDDSITYTQEYLSGKKFSLSEWNGVIIEKDSFTKHLPYLEPEVEEDLSLFEDLDDDGPLSTSDDDDDDFLQQVSNRNTSEDEEVLVDDQDYEEKDEDESEDISEEESTEDESGEGEEENLDANAIGDEEEKPDDVDEEEADKDEDTDAPDAEEETAGEEAQTDEDISSDDEESANEGVVDESEEDESEENEEDQDEVIEGAAENDTSDEDDDDYEDDDLDETEDEDIEVNEKTDVKELSFPKLPKDFELGLRVFTQKETKAVLLPEQLVEKNVPASIHERILFDINFFRKIITALKAKKQIKSFGPSGEAITNMFGALAGFISQILVYFWGIYLIIVTSLQIDVISEKEFLLVLPSFLIFVMSLEIRSNLIYGSEGFFTKVKRVILAPYYTGLIKIIRDENSGEYIVENAMGYLRYLLLSLNVTAIIVTVIRIIFYYEPRLNIAILFLLLFFFFVLSGSLLFFYTLSKKDEIIVE
ncbi:MAG: hypothetical protein SCALA702_09250 [Melioribacteraceae bacterium]|nr:MAG: hypothetical protein SCALA702_09250 [Melioribacteraceae bacterium]